jgi:hypothetical protein
LRYYRANEKAPIGGFISFDGYKPSHKFERLAGITLLIPGRSAGDRLEIPSEKRVV